MRASDALLDRWTGRTTPGAAYVHFRRDSVLHERYTGLADVGSGRPVDARTSFHGFSVTKTMTALAVVQLAQARRIDLDELVRTYLPSMPYGGDIRVRHLLTHTAGLPNPLPLSWVHPPDEPLDGGAFFAGIFTRHPRTRWAPGERFAYSNLGYVLLGQLIEQVTGKRYEEHITEAIFRPAGITGDELTFTHPPAAVHATGYLRTPSLLSLVLPFMVRTDRLFAERTGRWRAFRPFLVNGTAYGGSIGTATGYRKYLQALMTDDLLLSHEWRDALFAGNRTNSGATTGMAMAWFTGRTQGAAYVAHAGGGGGYYTELRIYPELGRGSVALFNRTGVKDERLLNELDEVR